MGFLAGLAHSFRNKPTSQDILLPVSLIVTPLVQVTHYQSWYIFFFIFLALYLKYRTIKSHRILLFFFPIVPCNAEKKTRTLSVYLVKNLDLKTMPVR